ncbi:MFS transporter [Streptomyces sp. NPDC008001]|uniref:MFS transporter n=1 Tax=Streptomyces sp. NPDC008001 TaxID=3364804 RepID=UPI0036E66739
MSTRPDPRRWWALGALVACMLVLGFDGTILNVALPAMAAQLGADAAEQTWIADSYLVVFAALMLPAGLLGDRFGRRRMLLAGLGTFLAGSLSGAFVTSPAQVIAARVVLGAGAALMMPLALSVLPSLFPAEERSKALGAVSAASALGLPLGPVVGGWLLDRFWWGSVFLVNVPLVALGIAACLFLLPETRDPASPKVGLLSTALTVTGLAALVSCVNEGPARGWASPLVLSALATAAVLLTALVLRERRAARPVLDVTLLRDRAFRWNTLAAALATLVLTGLLFVVPQHLQTVQGQDAFGTGLRMLPMMGGLLVASRATGPLVRRAGPRVVIPGALLLLAAAALTGSRTDVHEGYGFTALWLTIAGFGFGFGIIPAMDGALGALPRDRAGSGSGLLMTLRQVAGAIGVAVLGSLIAGSFADRLDTQGLPRAAADAAGDSVVAAHQVAARLGDAALARSADAAFVHGLDLALLACGIAAVAAALLTAVFLPGRAPAEPAGTGAREVVPRKADA